MPVEDESSPAPSADRAEHDLGVMPGIRHRQYLKTRRRNRCHPVFSDQEWAAVEAAAAASSLKPGGYAAAVTLAAALSENPEAAVADIRRLLEELMEADRQVAAIGNNVNQIAFHLNAGGSPPEYLQLAMARVVQALDGIDAASASIIGR
ncbi:MobC family plasmid mobilization relaxosome protein [Kitasatospora sp. NPDC052896]|uniref:MobC family plasmid mobilization relaxosome protein n=1 Tax=Kitasatospora sp. NPDC052896 TaxID=3364061 RepID=UPI0037CB9E1C